MPIEVLTEVEPFLKFGHYVLFSSKWKDPIGDTVRKVLMAQQIPRYKSYIVSAGRYVDVDLSTGSGFYPDSPSSLFEILFGMKSGSPPNVILYPRLPSTEYFMKLEESGQVPPDNPATDDDLRLIGGLTEDDINMEKPRLRIYTLKRDYMDRIVLRIYNNSADVTKVILRGTVNRIKLSKPVSEDEKKEIIKSGRYRWIPHWEDIKW
jgi:hypothetical protein